MLLESWYQIDFEFRKKKIRNPEKKETDQDGRRSASIIDCGRFS